MHHPGSTKPSLDKIANVGHAYKTLAKEKNYVTRINVMTMVQATLVVNVKRSGERLHHEKEICAIKNCCVCHDYVAWVAEQATHVALLHLITVTNQEE